MKFLMPTSIRYTYSMLIAEFMKEFNESEEYLNFFAGALLLLDCSVSMIYWFEFPLFLLL